MDPKHVLMRLGLMYLAEHGNRSVLHKAFLMEEGALQDAITKVKVVERDDNFIWVWTEFK